MAEPSDDQLLPSPPGPVLVSSDKAVRTMRHDLDELTALAKAKYDIKDYSSSAELYSKAAEIQDSLNGEMSVENAELLYAYGKCLYYVAVSKSDVLGDKVAGEQAQSSEKKSKPKVAVEQGGGGEASSSAATGLEEPRIAEEVVAQVVEQKEGTKNPATASQPFFQFTGDDNFVESDSEGDDAEAEGVEEAEEEEDDMTIAFEVLDMARILQRRKLDQLLSDENDGPSDTSSHIKQTQERLADIHDFQSEISMEGDRHANAVEDLKAALALKTELYPKDSSILAECHFKLSLALEFASVTQEKDENGQVTGKVDLVDEAMREEAAKELEFAIESCKLRVQKEEAELAAAINEPPFAEDAPRKRKQPSQADIDDVKEMVSDMEVRLIELRKPPVSINDPTSSGDPDGSNPLAGILGQILGESSEEQKKRVEEAMRGANDLTGLVKKKGSKAKVAVTNGTNGSATETEPTQATDGSGAAGSGSTAASKRKAVDFAEEVVILGTGKRARVDDADDAGN